MSRQVIQPDTMVVPVAPYSPVAVATGDLVFTAGQCGFDINGDLVSEDAREQVVQTMENLGFALAAAGCGFEDLVKVNVSITDWSIMPILNEVYKQYVKEPYPARVTLAIGLPDPFLVEIEGIASRPIPGS